MLHRCCKKKQKEKKQQLKKIKIEKEKKQKLKTLFGNKKVELLWLSLTHVLYKAGVI